MILSQYWSSQRYAVGESKELVAAWAPESKKRDLEKKKKLGFTISSTCSGLKKCPFRLTLHSYKTLPGVVCEKMKMSLYPASLVVGTKLVYIYYQEIP